MIDPLSPTTPIQNNTKKIDILIVVILSVALSILTFYSATAQFYDLERGNSYASITGWILQLPLLIISLPLYFLANSEGSALGFGILLELTSPVIAFIFWFTIFWFLAKLIKKLSKSDSWILRHFLSLVVVIVLIIPYLHYETGSNKIDLCLSGSLNSQMESGYFGSEPPPNPSYFTVGPDSCFDSIIESLIYKKPVSSKEAVDFCLDLSPVKIVQGTQTSYRDYCIYALGNKLYPNKSTVPDFTTNFHSQYMSDTPLPTYGELLNHEKDNEWWATYQSKLCEVYGSLTSSTENKNNCLVYFLNRPVSSDYRMSQIYCRNINAPVLPQRCTEKPELSSVDIKVNGLDNPTNIKLGSTIIVSWSVVGKAQVCGADETRTPLANGKGTWGWGENHYLPTEGSIAVIAYKPFLEFSMYCSPDSKSTFGSVRDSVTVNITN